MPDFTPDPDAVEEMADSMTRPLGFPFPFIGEMLLDADEVREMAETALRHAHAVALRAAREGVMYTLPDDGGPMRHLIDAKAKEIAERAGRGE